MINTVKRLFGFGQCNPKEGTTIVINSEKLERRVALLEEGVLEEYSIEREGEDNAHRVRDTLAPRPIFLLVSAATEAEFGRSGVYREALGFIVLLFL